MKADQPISSRQRVLLNLQRQPADRPAFSWSFGPQPPAQADIDRHLKPWGIDYQQLFDATSDILLFRYPQLGPPLPANRSIWGWTTKAQTYGQGEYDEFDFQPFANAETVADIERHPWPSPDQIDYARLVGQVRQADPEHRFARILFAGNILETFSWMTGLEKSLMLLLAEPEITHAALDRITTYYQAATQRALQTAAGEFDAVFVADDLGSQHGLLISPETYRRMLLPYHVRLNSTGRQFVDHIIHHSDGSVFGLLDDLIESGVSCLEAVQIECADMAPEKLKTRFGDRLAFQGAVSVQQVLPRLSPDEVRREVRRLKQVLGAGGGYLCAPSHAIQAGTPPANVIAMVEEAVELPLAEIVRNAKQRQ